jgi:hypothetical protein
MAFLPAKPADFLDREASDADLVQRAFYLVQLEGLDDGLNFFHAYRRENGLA